MKSCTWVCLAVVSLSATAVFSQQNAQPPAPDKPPVKKLSTLGGPTGGSNLTEDQVAALVTETTDEKTGVKLQFSAGFSARSVTPEEKRKYVKSGKIPYRIVCVFNEIRMVGGKPVATRRNGSAHINVFDAGGKLVEKRTASLDSMCPS